MEQILKISEFIVRSFIHIWPYLLVSIPLAVLVNLSGAAKYIHKALHKKPLTSIFLATAVGAISPFCSCGVIPVVASLLIGGVPLAPVMSFWIASPSMDPEIFLLSAATVGWKLSVWRLSATFVISTSAGIITDLFQKKGFFGNEILRSNLQIIPDKAFQKTRVQLAGFQNTARNNSLLNYGTAVGEVISTANGDRDCQCSSSVKIRRHSLFERILKESGLSFLMVTKFMMLAFLINALIKFYLPEDYVLGFVGGNGPFAVLIATLVGIPFYTSNLTALPLVSGLIGLGMNQGAALAFLIAGPVTTLPAMMAVWGIVRPRVFLAYLSYGLLGSVIFGCLFNLVYQII